MLVPDYQSVRHAYRALCDDVIDRNCVDLSWEDYNQLLGAALVLRRMMRSFEKEVKTDADT